MEITNNKALKDAFSSVFDMEDIEFLAQSQEKVVFSQIPALGLTQVSPTSLLDSLCKVVSLDASNRTWDFVKDLFEMTTNSDDKEKKKDEARKRELRVIAQKILDSANLGFEIGQQEFHSSLTKKA